MRERLAVRGTKYWIADKEARILVDYFDTKDEARGALKAMEAKEREEGYYIPYFYKIVEGGLALLRLQGYTALEDIKLLSDYC